MLFLEIKMFIIMKFLLFELKKKRIELENGLNKI